MRRPRLLARSGWKKSWGRSASRLDETCKFNAIRFQWLHPSRRIAEPVISTRALLRSSVGAHSRDPLTMRLRMRSETLMVRSASRRQVYVACVNLATMRVSNHEATGEAAIVRNQAVEGETGSHRQTSAFSRRETPELCEDDDPPIQRGRREDRVLSAHPRPVCIGRKHTVVTTGGAGSSGLPCAMVLTAYIVLSPGTGLSCPRRSQILIRDLSASVGAPGPHDFAVRVSAARLATPPRPPHPAPRS